MTEKDKEGEKRGKRLFGIKAHTVEGFATNDELLESKDQIESGEVKAIILPTNVTRSTIERRLATGGGILRRLAIGLPLYFRTSAVMFFLTKAWGFSWCYRHEHLIKKLVAARLTNFRPSQQNYELPEAHNIWR